MVHGLTAVIYAVRDEVDALPSASLPKWVGSPPAGQHSKGDTMPHVLVLFDKVSGAEHCLDVQIIDVVGYPCRAEIEQGLIYIIFYIALRISKYDHGERILIFKMLHVGPVLGGTQSTETDHGC